MLIITHLESKWLSMIHRQAMDATIKDATTMSGRNGHIAFFLWDTLNRKGCSNYLGHHFSVPIGPTGPPCFLQSDQISHQESEI